MGADTIQSESTTHLDLSKRVWSWEKLKKALKESLTCQTESISLSKASATFSDTAELCLALKTNGTNVKRIDLSHNQLRPYAIDKDIAKIIEESPHLEELDLSFNPFDVDPLNKDELGHYCMERIFRAVETNAVNHYALRSLRLDGIKLSDEGKKYKLKIENLLTNRIREPHHQAPQAFFSAQGTVGNSSDTKGNSTGNNRQPN